MNIKFIYDEQNLERDKFINDYIDFVIEHNGLRPYVNSEIEEEKILARKFNSINSVLTQQESFKIDNIIRKLQKQHAEESFFEKYLEFVVNNGRLPCGNSDNPEEVYLNNAYINLNKKLNKDQKKTIAKLQAAYKQATLLATIEFRKKMKEGQIKK